MALAIPTILPWGPIKEISTPYGRRAIRTAAPSHSFWNLWRAAKSRLVNLGVRVKKVDGKWVVEWQSELDGTFWEGEGSAETSEQSPVPLQNVRGLLSYQTAPVAVLNAALRRWGAALDASDCGVGKTYAAAALFRELGVRPAIVCPKSIIPAWKRVLALFGVEPCFVLNYEQIRTGKHAWAKIDEAAGFFEWRLPDNAALGFDEVHRCAGDETLNARMLVAAKLSGRPVHMMSATAAEKPGHLRAIGYVLGLHHMSDFFPWAGKYGLVKNDWTGAWEFQNPEENALKLNKLIFPAHGTRIRIADLGDTFPETQITAESYDVDGKEDQIDAIYRAMYDELVQKEAEALEWIVALLRARQKVELLKVPLLVDLTRDLIEEGKSVVIFSLFKDTIAYLKQELNTTCCIEGDQHPSVRQFNLDAFQADRERVILCNIKAGGEGIELHDTHGKYPRATLICPTTRATEMRQALGRVVRSGGMSKSIQRIIFAAGTIEEKTCQAVQKKLHTIALLNDGDLVEGLPFAL